MIFLLDPSRFAQRKTTRLDRDRLSAIMHHDEPRILIPVLVNDFSLMDCVKPGFEVDIPHLASPIKKTPSAIKACQPLQTQG